MATLPPVATLLILAIAAGAAFAILHVIAMRLRNDKELRVLVRSAIEARHRHERRMHALRTGSTEGDVEILEDEEEDFIVGESIEDAQPVTAEAAKAMEPDETQRKAA